MSGNSDYVSVINSRHYARITGYIHEAKKAGARVELLANDAYSTEVADSLVAQINALGTTYSNRA